MASTYKTNYLGLNKFVGSDKPKMDDFNFDNETLDQKFQEHVQSSLQKKNGRCWEKQIM